MNKPMTSTRPLRERLQDVIADAERAETRDQAWAILPALITALREALARIEEQDQKYRLMECTAKQLARAADGHKAGEVEWRQRAESAEQQRDRYAEDWQQAVQALRAEEARRSDAESQLAAERQANRGDSELLDRVQDEELTVREALQERERLKVDLSSLRAPQEASMGVTRVEVFDDSGRVLTRYVRSCELSYQDGGRTLKLFLSGDNTEARTENAKALANDSSRLRSRQGAEADAGTADAEEKHK